MGSGGGDVVCLTVDDDEVFGASTREAADPLKGLRSEEHLDTKCSAVLTVVLLTSHDQEAARRTLRPSIACQAEVLI